MPSGNRREQVTGELIKAEEILNQQEHMVICKGSVIPDSVAVTARGSIIQDLRKDTQAGAMEDTAGHEGEFEAEDRRSQDVQVGMDLKTW